MLRGLSILSLLLVVVTTTSVRAHDPFEITADVRPREAGLELRITLAWTTCLRVCHGGKPPATRIPPEDFEIHRELISKCAAGFFTVTADNEPLAVCDVRVELTVENDIDVVVVFAPPAQGTVRFEAALLRLLPSEGYGSRFTILARTGSFLGQDTLWAEQPVFEIAAAALQ